MKCFTSELASLDDKFGPRKPGLLAAQEVAKNVDYGNSGYCRRSRSRSRSRSPGATRHSPNAHEPTSQYTLLRRKHSNFDKGPPAYTKSKHGYDSYYSKKNYYQKQPFYRPKGGGQGYDHHSNYHHHGRSESGGAYERRGEYERGYSKGRTPPYEDRRVAQPGSSRDGPQEMHRHAEIAEGYHAGGANA